MEYLLSKDIENGKFELEIDTEIFSKDIILKSAFQFLDIGYFFFKTGKNNSIILQFTPKKGIDKESEVVIGDFSDTLLETSLRNKLESDNRIIRETIVTKAINGPLDMKNFVTLDSEDNTNKNQIDFDKDIDEILKEIENDPDLKIDETEINKILSEIEEETESELQKPKVNVDMEAIKNAKNNFKKSK